MAFQFVWVLTSSPWFVVLDQILNPDNLALRYLKIRLKVSSGSEKCVNIIILFVLVFIQSIVGFPINKKEKEVWEQKKHLLRHFLWMWESYGPPKYWLISPRKKNFFYLFSSLFSVLLHFCLLSSSLTSLVSLFCFKSMSNFSADCDAGGSRVAGGAMLGSPLLLVQSYRNQRQKKDVLCPLYGTAWFMVMMHFFSWTFIFSIHYLFQ